MSSLVAGRDTVAKSQHSPPFGVLARVNECNRLCVLKNSILGKV